MRRATAPRSASSSIGAMDVLAACSHRGRSSIGRRSRTAALPARSPIDSNDTTTRSSGSERARPSADTWATTSLARSPTASAFAWRGTRSSSDSGRAASTGSRRGLSRLGTHRKESRAEPLRRPSSDRGRARTHRTPFMRSKARSRRRGSPGDEPLPDPRPTTSGATRRRQVDCRRLAPPGMRQPWAACVVHGLWSARRAAVVLLIR